LGDKNGKRITNNFPIESLIVKITQMQPSSLFAKIASYFNKGL